MDTPSRSRTPSATVHRLLRPSLSAKASTSSLHTTAQAQVAQARVALQHLAVDRTLDTPSGIVSSASSVSNVPLGDTHLVTQVDDENDAEEVIGIEADFATDPAAQKHLRDQLRRTLTNQSSASIRPNNAVLNSVVPPPVARNNRQYFVLTDAGKPVLNITFGENGVNMDPQDDTTAITGVMQAIISVFADNGDKLKFINAGNTRITFLLRPPLYFVAVSPVWEPEHVARMHLDYIYLQILSICTASQIRKMFQRRANSDLQRLLQGSDSVVKGLVKRMQTDIGMSFQSLVALRMDSSLRSRASEAIVPTSKLKDVLYSILIADDRVVTLARPRKHSIHPADLHILLNTMGSPSLITASASASASWLPICLPKYNQEGFTHTYVSYLKAEIGLSLVCVCGASEFETIRQWVDGIAERLEIDGTVSALESATKSSNFSVAELGIPGIRHFVYKSKLHVQLTMPIFEDPYAEEQQQERLLGFYHILYDSVHAKSGQEGQLKLQYMRTEAECVMAWITQPFELYLALSPSISKNAAVSAANAVARWVRKEEARLFIKDAPVF